MIRRCESTYEQSEGNRRKQNVHRINEGKYMKYMVSSYALITPALISGGDDLAVVIDPKILRICVAVSLSPRYLFKFFGIFSLYEFTSGQHEMNGCCLLPDSGGDCASNGTTDARPKGQ